MPRLRTYALGIVIAAGLAAPASAAPGARTRLVECRSQTCLLVAGRRADAGATVRINGHEVPVEGGRKWRVRLPVDTVRAWSAPYARTIMVSTMKATEEVDLPIGMLGHREDLAMLVVRVK